MIIFEGKINMSVKEKFEKEFYEEEQEIIVLIKANCGGAAVFDGWLRPSVNFIASIDCKTGKLDKNEGILNWLIKDDKNRKNWGYDLKQYGIYKLLVKKCIPVELNHYQSEKYNNRYMLVKLLEENVHNDKLQSLKERYLIPITIKNELGIFTLNRECSIFESDIEWNGVRVSVFLETDEDNGETTETAMNTLLKYVGDKQGFDRKNREYAAQELLQAANDWLADDDSEDKADEITRDMFINRMEIAEIVVNSDGSVTLFYDDGEMFWGHSIEVSIAADGECESADIVG